MVEETYFKPHNSLLSDQQTQAMINSDSQYSQVISEAMNRGQQESNTHIVNEFDKHNHTFIVTETQSPLQTPRPLERFRVCYNPKSVIVVNIKLNTYRVLTS